MTTIAPTTTTNAALLVGRILLAAIFVLAGYNKITGYAGSVAYMEAYGLPGILLPGAILFEFVGGLAIVAGFQTRLAALAIAAFSIIAALVFHNKLSEPMQMIMFMKNFAIAGGFLVLFASGPGAYSVDARRAA
jgi:putative oxidoreductase